MAGVVKSIALGLLLLSGSAGVALAGSLYAGPNTDVAFTVIAPELSGALWSERPLPPQPVADTNAALARVAADPDSLAIAELALMLDASARNKWPADRLNFVDLLGQRCLTAFTLQGGWVRNFADLATNASPAPTIGVAGPNAGAMLAMLQRFDPGLAGLDVQQGTAEELAGRLARGTLDVLLVSATFGYEDKPLMKLADEARFTRMAPVTRQVTRAATGPEGGMTLSQMRIDRGSVVAWPRTPETMLCTPLGVVLRGDAPGGLKSAVTLARPRVAAALRTSLKDRATTEFKGMLDDATGTMRRLLDNF
jgi:hypothetical protein